MQLIQAFNTAFEFVTALHRANTGRCSGHDDVAVVKPEQTRQVTDHFREFPDEMIQIALLTKLTINVQ